MSSFRDSASSVNYASISPSKEDPGTLELNLHPFSGQDPVILRPPDKDTKLSPAHFKILPIAPLPSRRRKSPVSSLGLFPHSPFPSLADARLGGPPVKHYFGRAATKSYYASHFDPEIHKDPPRDATIKSADTLWKLLDSKVKNPVRHFHFLVPG